MDTTTFYSDYLSIFISLIIAGIAFKLAIQEQNNKTYQIGNKEYSKQKVHTAATLGLMGVVIQIVSNTMKTLDGSQLLLDEKIIGAYAFAILVMVFKK